MIKSIVIKNVALIESLYLEFENGLNIITGETGAGKSILLGAVNLILGGKGSPDVIRSGCDKASVEVTFDVQKASSLKQILTTSGISIDDDLITIKRELTKDGRNNCFINLGRISVSNLKTFGELLVDISSQHQHQSLLKISNHLFLLDSFGGLVELREDFAKTFSHYKQLYEKLENLRSDREEKRNQLEYNKFVANEIENANLIYNEDVELEKQLNYLNNFRKLKDNVHNAYSLVYQDETSIVTLIEKVLYCLDNVKQLEPKLNNVVDNLEEVSFKMEEVYDELKTITDNLEYSPEQLEQVLERIEIIKNLKKKYGSTIQKVIFFKEKCEKEIETINLDEQQIKTLEDEVDQLQKQIATSVLKLSNHRQAKAKELEEMIEAELTFLGMQSSTFKIEFRYVKDDLSFIKLKEQGIKVEPNGIDKIEFTFSANKGEPPKPLVKIISGGELSRVMLAIKSILARSDEINTLIFDEVDAGIGGETAIKVGNKIKKLANNKQVVCITHSPQLAGFSDYHYLAMKKEDNKRTTTNIIKLSNEEKVNEIARMLGGDNITSVSVEHAKEIIGKVNEENI